MKDKSNKITAIDLFCGVGGLTNGLQKAGIHVKLGIDNDPDCEYSFTQNNEAEFLLKPVEDVSVEELEGVFPKDNISLLAGCAPCQTFSTYNRKAGPSDKRWWLLSEFSRIVEGMLPKIVTMENVPGLTRTNVFKDFVEDLKRLNYEVEYQIVNSAEYGVPQERKRLVLLASQFGPIKLLDPSQLNLNTVTVRDVISNLPPIKAGETHKKDKLHQSSGLSKLNLKRIKASRPGGTWRDWDEELIAKCHKKKSGKTYPSVYGRMCWDEPAPTITTQFYGYGNGRFGHPEQDRAISLREGAILQSFPSDYSFIDPDEDITKRSIGKLIGNAVPVKLAEAIGKSIVKHVNNYYGRE